MPTSAEAISVDAVIVTRNRVHMLSQTIKAIQQSTHPVRRIIVSDDSSDAATALYLEGNVPEAIRIEGPRRGIAANRNSGLAASDADYILLSDDDMQIHPRFIELALSTAVSSSADLVFGGTSDNGKVIYPNTLGFLGFSDVPYRPGQPYNTANQQCFLISKHLASAVTYDENIRAYGYEEMDYGYRVSAAGYLMLCVKDCVNVHLNPNTDFAFRPIQDASRLYVTFKRELFVNRSVGRAAVFVVIALPHHLVACVRREGGRGIVTALRNFRVAANMLRGFIRNARSPRK